MAYGNGVTAVMVAGSAYTNAPSAPPATISAHLHALGKGMDEVAALVSELEVRLDMALRPVPPHGQPQEAQQDPRVLSAPLAHGLSEVNSQLIAIAGRLRHVIERIEL